MIFKLLFISAIFSVCSCGRSNEKIEKNYTVKNPGKISVEPKRDPEKKGKPGKLKTPKKPKKPGFPPDPEPKPIPEPFPRDPEPEPLPKPEPEPFPRDPEPEPKPEPKPQPPKNNFPDLRKNKNNFYWQKNWNIWFRWPWCTKIPRSWQSYHNQWWSHLKNKYDWCIFHKIYIVKNGCQCRIP